MTNFLEISQKNTQKAWHVIKDAKIVNSWEAVGAKVRLVGSLKLGLMMKKLDADFHIYSKELDIFESFFAIQKIAENPRIKTIEYKNLIDTDEACIEWHAVYEADDGEIWKFDMIHILEGSKFDGYFERVGERILEIITPKQREIILRLKYETPDDVNIIGIEYYMAVIRDNIETYEELMDWKQKNPLTGIVEWMP